LAKDRFAGKVTGIRQHGFFTDIKPIGVKDKKIQFLWPEVWKFKHEEKNDKRSRDTT